MRHKYETRGVVLARVHVGEANTFVTLMTPELGLVYARAQSVRKPGAKLAHALATLTESSLVLVRGKEGWRVAGAVLEKNWFTHLPISARLVAGRVSSLLLRLVAGEVHDPALFSIIIGLFEVLGTLPEEEYEIAEMLAVLRVLAVLGLDTGDLPGEMSAFTPAVLAEIMKERARYLARINRGIAASGL